MFSTYDCIGASDKTSVGKEENHIGLVFSDRIPLYAVSPFGQAVIRGDTSAVICRRFGMCVAYVVSVANEMRAMGWFAVVLGKRVGFEMGRYGWHLKQGK